MQIFAKKIYLSQKAHQESISSKTRFQPKCEVLLPHQKHLTEKKTFFLAKFSIPPKYSTPGYF
jgi:hypothetical protein